MPNLWINSLTIRVEDVSKAQKKPCTSCGVKPIQLGDRRLVVQKGSGKRHTLEVFCMSCGARYLEEKVEEAKRAVLYLKQGNVCIRSHS